MTIYPKPHFPTWKVEIFNHGYDLGIAHAQTGDPNDFSDARCKPLEEERDSIANEYPFGKERGAFLGGYEAGYESIFKH